MEIRNRQRTPSQMGMSRGRRLASTLLPIILVTAASCGEASGGTAAPASKPSAPEASSTSPTTQTTRPTTAQAPAQTSTPKTETSLPSPATTMTVEATSSVPAEEPKCAGFNVEKDGPDNKKVTPVIKGQFPSLKNVVTIIETYDYGLSLASAQGLGATATPPYAGDLMPGSDLHNPHFQVTILDYRDVPGGLPTPLPTTTAEAPDSVHAYRCV